MSDNIFSSKLVNLSSFQKKGKVARDSQIIELDCASIICHEQVRNEDNEGFLKETLIELGGSMKDDGQIEPVIVRPDPDKLGSYIMVAGERRFRAAKMFKLKLKAVVLDIDAKTARRIQIAENIHRQNFSQKETASAVFTDYKELGGLEAVAKVWKKSANWVSQMIQFHQNLADPSSPATKMVENNMTSDVTAINDMAKLGKLDVGAAFGVLDQLALDPDANVRQTVKDKLKETKDGSKVNGKKNVKKKQNKDSEAIDAGLAPKKMEINCKSLDKLLKMATAAISITSVCIDCSKDIIRKITISIKTSPDSKESQDLVFLADNYPLAQGFTVLFKKLPTDKLAQNFASHIYIK